MTLLRAFQIYVFSIGLVACAGRPSDPQRSAPDTVRAAPETVSVSCNPPLRDCLACNGAHFCGRVCPLCPPATRAAGEADSASAAPELVCRFPLRQCFDCRGNPICAQHCPECAPMAVPVPDELPALAELTPVLEACGPINCAPGLHCCNPTCALCTPKGVNCTQQTCN
jgi:hypothetical protein